MVRKKVNKYEDMSISQLKKIYEECINTIKEIEEVFKEAPIYNYNQQDFKKYNYPSTPPINSISNQGSSVNQRPPYYAPSKTNLTANENSEDKAKVVLDDGYIFQSIDPLEEPFDVNNLVAFKGLNQQVTEYTETKGLEIYSPTTNLESEEVLDPQEEVNRQLEVIKQEYKLE